MALFVMSGKYTAEAIRAVSKKRTELAKGILKECGGKLVAGYATLGASDVLLVADLPGIDEAVKASIEMTRALGIAFSTAPAVSVEEFDNIVG